MLIQNQIAFTSIRSMCRVSSASNINELLSTILGVPQREAMVQHMGLLDLSANKMREFIEEGIIELANPDVVERMINECIACNYLMSKSEIECFTEMSPSELRDYIGILYHGIISILLLERFSGNRNGRKVVDELMDRLDAALFVLTGVSSYEPYDMLCKAVNDLHSNSTDFKPDALHTLAKSRAIMETMLCFILTCTFDTLVDTGADTPLGISWNGELNTVANMHGEGDSTDPPSEFLFMYYEDGDLHHHAKLVLTTEEDKKNFLDKVLQDEFTSRLRYPLGILLDMFTLEELEENNEKREQIYEVGDEFFDKNVIDCIIEVLKKLKR